MVAAGYTVKVLGSDGVVTDYLSTYGDSEVDHGVTTGSKAEMPDVEADKRLK